jgi:hypothetical protein
MFPAISNLDVSWPDPKVAGLDQIQKFLQCSNQYIIQSSSASDSIVSATYSAGDYNWYDMTISKDGIIAIAPLLGSNFSFYNTNNNQTSGSTGAAKPVNIAYVTYAAYNNRFYYGAANPTFGIYYIDAASTGSSSTIISGSATNNRNSCVADGNKLWLGTQYNAAQKPAYLNLDTNYITQVGNTTIPAGGGAQPAVCPNGLIIYGTENTTINYYDPSTDTVSSFAGTVDSVSCQSWILGRDGYMYAVPRGTSTNVYRIDPYKKTLAVAYTGAPYTAGQNKRGMWMSPSGQICTFAAANTVIAYDPILNQAYTLPYTISYSANRHFQGVTAANGSMYILNASSQLIRFNNVNSRNLFNDAYQGSEYNKGNVG